MTIRQVLPYNEHSTDAPESAEEGRMVEVAVKLLICDDDAASAEKLRQLIELYSQRTGIGFQVSICTQRDEILQETQQSESYDVLFLDIYLESLNGVEVARLIRSSDANVKIVFISTSPLHALEAFGVNASQYLVKPVSYSSLSKTLELLLKETREEGFISVCCTNQIVKIFLKNLMYTETQRHYQALYLANGTMERARMTRGELCDLLGGQKRFAKVGASFLVNLDYVVRVASDRIELMGDRVIHIPRRALADLKRQYFDYYYDGEDPES